MDGGRDGTEKGLTIEQTLIMVRDGLLFINQVDEETKGYLDRARKQSIRPNRHRLVKHALLLLAEDEAAQAIDETTEKEQAPIREAIKETGDRARELLSLAPDSGPYDPERGHQ